MALIYGMGDDKDKEGGNAPQANAIRMKLKENLQDQMKAKMQEGIMGKLAGAKSANEE